VGHTNTRVSGHTQRWRNNNQVPQFCWKNLETKWYWTFPRIRRGWQSAHPRGIRGSYWCVHMHRFRYASTTFHSRSCSSCGR